MEYIDLQCILKAFCLLPPHHAPQNSQGGWYTKAKRQWPFPGVWGKLLEPLVLEVFGSCFMVLTFAAHTTKDACDERGYFNSLLSQNIGVGSIVVLEQKRRFRQTRTDWKVCFLQSSGRREYHLSPLPRAKYGNRTEVLPKHSVRFIKISKSSLYKLRKPLWALIWKGFW